MPAYCYSLLDDTVIVPTCIIIMQVYTSIFYPFIFHLLDIYFTQTYVRIVCLGWYKKYHLGYILNIRSENIKNVCEAYDLQDY